MNASFINLACGREYVDSPDWINFDFAATSPAVTQVNLLQPLPVPSSSARLVYSSHFLEHVPLGDVDAFLQECLRVLQPAGVLRLVLPDLEEMARTYLRLRETGDHERADFLVLEMIDQCVRREPGGELGRFYHHLVSAPEAQAADMLAFVRERTGEDLTHAKKLQSLPRRANPQPALVSRSVRALRARLRQVWVRLLLAGVPAAFRAQNVSLAAVGERHQWLWDFHQLCRTLQSAGFVEVQRRSADHSALADFPCHLLDLDPEGLPRKGAGSMYVEATKPA
jgi:ubiquinone/menaquinone biosynthesis C-methylase UbiE